MIALRSILPNGQLDPQHLKNSIARTNLESGTALAFQAGPEVVEAVVEIGVVVSTLGIGGEPSDKVGIVSSSMANILSEALSSAFAAIVGDSGITFGELRETAFAMVGIEGESLGDSREAPSIAFEERMMGCGKSSSLSHCTCLMKAFLTSRPVRETFNFFDCSTLTALPSSAMRSGLMSSASLLARRHSRFLAM
jgi:hypothetical protein